MKIFCWKLESFGIFVFLFEIMLLVFDILFIFIVVDDNQGDGYFIVRGEFCCCFFYFFVFINDVVNVCQFEDDYCLIFYIQFIRVLNIDVMI